MDQKSAQYTSERMLNQVNRDATNPRRKTNAVVILTEPTRRTGQIERMDDGSTYNFSLIQAIGVRQKPGNAYFR
jgi:hypothetical protein